MGVRVGVRVEVTEGGIGVFVGVGLRVGVEELEEQMDAPFVEQSEVTYAAQLDEEHKLA